jgi:DNA-binding CsgD family transcriptional regulator
MDNGDAYRVESVARALTLLPTSSPADAILDALAPVVSVAGGMISVLQPTEPTAMISRAVRFPSDVMDDWMSTPDEQTTRVLSPMFSAQDGELWLDTETVPAALRERLTVLQKLDANGFGVCAGYKVATMHRPGRGIEHLMLVLAKPRGESFSPDSRAALRRLGPSIREVLLRADVPLVPSKLICHQILEEQLHGYACLSLSGGVIEANRRAYVFAERYGGAAQIASRRCWLADFMAQARAHVLQGQPWVLWRPDRAAVLEVFVHHLAKEAHAVPEDTLLVTMRETCLPPRLMDAPSSRAELTPREAEMAHLLEETGLSIKEIATKLDITDATARKHVERLYKKLKIHSRAELRVRVGARVG